MWWMGCDEAMERRMDWEVNQSMPCSMMSVCVIPLDEEEEEEEEEGLNKSCRFRLEALRKEGNVVCVRWIWA